MCIMSEWGVRERIKYGWQWRWLELEMKVLTFGVLIFEAPVCEYGCVGLMRIRIKKWGKVREYGLLPLGVLLLEMGKGGIQ